MLKVIPSRASESAGQLSSIAGEMFMPVLPLKTSLATDPLTPVSPAAVMLKKVPIDGLDGAALTEVTRLAAAARIPVT